MPTYTIETPLGKRLKIESDTPEEALKLADQWTADTDAVVRTTYGEARGDPASQPGVASVILNRANLSGKSPQDVVRAKGQFEPWGDPAARAKMDGLNPQSPEYQAILKNIAPALGGEDPTGGATHFYAPKAQAALGRNAPQWDDGTGTDLGQHRFFARPQEFRGNGVAVSMPNHPELGEVQAPGRPRLPQKSMRPDDALGFVKGAVQPWANLATKMDTANRGLTPDSIDPALSAIDALTPSGIMSLLARRAGRKVQGAVDTAAQAGVRPGKLGEFAGNVVTTLPIPGGPIANGAMSGVALSQHDDPAGIARDAAYGAIGGKLGASLVGGLGRVVSGVTDDAVQRLAQKGVPMTLGQLAGQGVMGRMVRGVEDRVEGLPIIGDVVSAARRRSVEAGNRAAFNDALSEIRASLPEDINLGSDALTYTKGLLSDAYDAVLQPLVMPVDKAASNTLRNFRTQIKALPADIQKTLTDIVDREILFRIKSGHMTGEDMKAAQESLGSHIEDLMRGKKWERDAGKLLKGLKTGLEDWVSRVSPEAGAGLAAVNRGYAKVKPLEGAVAAAKKDGVFSGQQLLTAIGVGKTNAAKAGGRLPQTQLARDMATRLPSQVPDSGTAGRLALPSLIGMIASGHIPTLAPVMGPAATPLTILAGLTSLYTRSGQKALTAALTKRSPVVQKVGQNVRRLAAPAGTAGAVGFQASRN